MSLVILAGPSAIGKSHMAQLLLSQYPDSFTRVPVHTTRPKRASEAQQSDRIFVAADVFERMIQDDQFFVHEEFAGHWYGYHREHFTAPDKHLLIDLPPYFLPAFLPHNDIVTVGLQAPKTSMAWLDARMQNRGDSLQSRTTRKPYIKRDMNDMEKMRPLIEKHGKLFYVQDDTTLPQQVIPWLIAHLQLSS